MWHLLSAKDGPNLADFGQSNLVGIRGHDDTAVVTMDSDPAIASQKLQSDLHANQSWFKKRE
jgi:hypothetical protein